MSEAADCVTILAARGRRLAKRIAADGTIESYDSARTFDMFERAVSSLADMNAILADLAAKPDRCIVRGAIADPSRTCGVRRLLHDDPETGDRATLVDMPRRWVAVDLDSVPVPSYINRECLFECGMEVSGLLPREFRGCAFVVQATAQHCIAEGARVRLWFWLDRPVSGVELRHWFRGCPVDFSAFAGAQICYTAAPVFESGTDILPNRLELMPGPDIVRVPPSEALRPPPPPPPPRAMPEIGDSRAQRYAAGAMRGAMLRVRAAAVGGRHSAILGEARSLGRLVAAGALPESAMRAVLFDAARATGKTDEAEISAAIAWGLAHPSDGQGACHGR